MALLISSWLWGQLLRLSGVVSTVLGWFTLFTAQVVLLGYGLSALGKLNEWGYWTVGSLILAGIGGGVAIGVKGKRLLFGSLPKFSFSLDTFHRRLGVMVGMTILLVGVANLVLVVGTVPNNSDSLSYHLSRAAYYWQYGSLDRYYANYWAQITHLKVPALLLGYLFGVTGRNESLLQLIQFVSYWISLLAMFGIARRLGATIVHALLAAGVGGLVTVGIAQATTTQNDWLVTVYAGISFYFLTSSLSKTPSDHPMLTGLATGLLLATKTTALAIVPALLFWSWIMGQWSLKKWRSGVWVIIPFLLLTLPAGYIENKQYSGHLLGPTFMRQLFTFEGQPPSKIAQFGAMNMLRYGFEFLDLDGLPDLPPIHQINQWISYPPRWVVTRLGIDLEATAGIRMNFTFQYDDPLRADEDQAFWGILGFGLFGMTAGLILLGRVRAQMGFALVCCAISFGLMQAFSGPYDRFHARYFLTMVIWLVPAFALTLPFFTQSRFWRSYLLGVIAVGCLSALSTVLIRPDNPLFSIQFGTTERTSKLLLDRLDQFILSRPDCVPMREFERLVPAQATVAVYLPDDACEYPLFGQKWQRTLIPIRWIEIPNTADYLLYDQTIFAYPLPTDQHLGLNWYLRNCSELC